MPAISVVVPCYNGGKYLDQLTACLARQTFRDFEVVIVDDASNDGTTRAKLAALDPAIRVVRHPENRRMAAARNTGFSYARADFVMVLDCDDQLEPTYLEETFAVLQSAPQDAGFAFTHDRQTGTRQQSKKNYFNVFDALFKFTTGYAMLIRKAAWQKAGGYDETMRDGYEDWEFNLRLIRAGYHGIEIPKPLFIYNVSMQGMMMSHSSRMHAVLWRRIRHRHAELYRISNLIRLYRENRTARSELSPLYAIAALILTSVIPDSWYSALIHFVRSRRLLRSDELSASAARHASLRPGARPTR